jgi:hypothetical protein
MRSLDRKHRKPRNRECSEGEEPSALARALGRAAHRRVHVEQRVSAGKPVLRVHVEGGES